MKNKPSREARRKGLDWTANRWDLSVALLALLGVASLFTSCQPAFAQSPAVCVVSGTVLDGGSQPIVGTPVRFRVISPVLASTGAALAVQDLTTTTAAGGAWSLTLVQGLNAQVDIPAVGIAKDTVIPSGVSCPAAFSSLTLYNRGTLTPATILSTAGPSMGGDLTGSSPNPTVVGLRGQTLAAGACTNGQARVYSSGSSSYTCQTVTTGAGVTSVSGGTGITVTGTTTPSVAITAAGVGPTQLASGAASTNVGTLSGDLSGTLPAPTVAAGAITDSKVNAGAAIAWSKINKAGATAADVGAVASGSAVTSVTAGTGISLSGTGVAPIVNIANGGVTATQLGTGAAASNVGSLGGDFSGTLPNPSIAAGVIVDADVNAAANIAWTKVSKAGAAESDIPGLVADLADKLSKGSGGTVVGNTTFSGTTTFNGAAIFSGSFAPAGEFRVVRTADATSPSPQKVSNNAVFEGSVWNGSAPEKRLFTLRNTPTGLNAGKLSFLGYSTDNVVGSELAYIDATTGQYNGPTAGLHTGNVTGNLTGNVTGNVTGTAATFTGSLTGDVTSSAMATTVQTVSGQTAANVAAGAVLANAATALNTASAIVKRDGSNNFAAGTITANLTGNVTGALTGNATTASDGLTSASGTAPLTLSLAAKSLTGSIADASAGAKGVVQLAGDLNGTAASPGVATVGGQTAANVAAGAVLANAATSSSTINTIVKRDGSGNFIAGTITAALAGNATTATNVTMGGDASGNSSAATVTKIQGNPVLAGTPTNGQVYQYVTANGRFEATTLTGTGTVTSVNASGGSTGFSFTGGPISSSGTLTLTGTLGLANGGTNAVTAAAGFNNLSPMTTLGDMIYGGPSGAGTRLAGNTTTTRQFLISQGSAGLATAPTLGALIAGDVPNLAATQVTTGWPTGYLKGAAGALTAQTVPIPVADGGTGATTLASGVIHGNGTSALTSSQVNLATEVTGTLPAASVGAGFVKVDGSTALTADWTTGNFAINSKNSQTLFNVARYGCALDGVTDDATCFTNALSAAGAVFGTVYIPATTGGMRLASAITIPRGVSIIGNSGAGNTTASRITCDLVGTCLTFTSGAATNHFSLIEGLDIRKGTSAPATLLLLNNAWFVEISRCYFATTGAGESIRVTGNSAHLNLRHNFFQGVSANQVKLGAGGASDFINAVIMERNEFTAATTGAVYVNAVNSTITSVADVFEGNAGYGLRIDASTVGNTENDITIVGGYFEGNNGGYDIDINPAGNSVASNKLVVNVLGGHFAGTGVGLGAIRMNQQTSRLKVQGIRSVTHTVAGINLGASPTSVATIAIDPSCEINDATKISASAPAVAGSNFLGFAANDGMVIDGGAGSFLTPLTIASSAGGGPQLTLNNRDATSWNSALVFAAQGASKWRVVADSGASGANTMGFNDLTNAKYPLFMQGDANGGRAVFGGTNISTNGILSWVSPGSTTSLAVPGVLFTQTANKVTTANTLTSLFGTGVGTLTLPANMLVAGRTLKVRMGGFVSAADGGVGTKTLTLLLGGVTIATGTSGATFATVLNAPWEATAMITNRTTGAPGTCIGNARFDTQIATANLNSVMAAATATANCTTTGTLLLDLQFNNGNATGTVTTTWAEVEVIN